MARATYQIGRRRGKNWRLIVGLLIALSIVVGGWYIVRQFRHDTVAVIKNSAGTSHPFEIPNSKTQHFDEGNFAFDLPADWKLIKHDTAPYNLYSFRATLKNADNRYLDVYADSLPLSLAVNKAVAVRSQGDNLTHGMASDNCTTFTTGGSTNASGVKALSFQAKWDGVEFICDNDTNTRNVIGTSSPGNINKLTLNGASSGAHSFFFVYTDNNYQPDYSIFYNMLESLIVK